MKNKISENYKKYLIKIVLNGKSRLMISGMDISNNDEDFILTDIHNKILLFDNFQQIKKLIQENIVLPDKENLVRWVTEQHKIEFYARYNIDDLLNKVAMLNDICEIEKESYSLIVDLINIIGDYSYQTNQSVLIQNYENQILMDFKDFFLDKYIWKNENKSSVTEIIKTENYFSNADFKKQLNILFDLFTKNFSEY